MIKILLGGSPCTNWSIAQKANREVAPEGIGWELFENYVIAKNKFNPNYFIYENNVSASTKIKKQIQSELKVDDTTNYYIEINSASVSAQVRKRFYVHNCGEVKQPIDRDITLEDILENGIRIPSYGYENKSRPCEALYCNHSGVGIGSLKQRLCSPNPCKQQNDLIAVKSSKGAGFRVKDGLLYIDNTFCKTPLEDGWYTLRRLSVKEYCRLQTLPDNYCDGVSPTRAYHAIGNGWTAEVIIHILNAALTNIPRDEEIVVLSMYDGIGTGRYCLDKMGFTNIKYYAYEIDKYAIQIAHNNYPDIIELGNCFDVRNKDWEICY